MPWQILNCRNNAEKHAFRQKQNEKGFLLLLLQMNACSVFSWKIKSNQHVCLFCFPVFVLQADDIKDTYDVAPYAHMPCMRL